MGAAWRDRATTRSARTARTPVAQRAGILGQAGTAATTARSSRQLGPDAAVSDGVPEPGGDARLVAADAARPAAAAAGVRRAARRQQASRSATARSRCSRSCCSPASRACSRPRPRGACSTTATTTRVLVAIWAFIAGGIYGAFGYFAVGALLHARREGARLAGHLSPRAARARVRLRPDRAVAGHSGR